MLVVLGRVNVFLFLIIVMKVLNALIAEVAVVRCLHPYHKKTVKCHSLIYVDDLVVFLHPLRPRLHLHSPNSRIVRESLRPLHQPRQMHDDTHSLLPDHIQAVQQVFPC